jgi:hypothetical protein
MTAEDFNVLDHQEGRKGKHSGIDKPTCNAKQQMMSADDARDQDGARKEFASKRKACKPESAEQLGATSRATVSQNDPKFP